jgi:hypothetical protein
LSRPRAGAELGVVQHTNSITWLNVIHAPSLDAPSLPSQTLWQLLIGPDWAERQTGRRTPTHHRDSRPIPTRHPAVVRPRRRQCSWLYR